MVYPIADIVVVTRFSVTQEFPRDSSRLCRGDKCVETHGAAKVTGWRVRCLPTLRPVEQELRVDTAGVHAMATRWGASVGDLNETVAPTGLGLSCQTSAAAVDAAHVDVAAFTAGLAARVGERASGVVQADPAISSRKLRRPPRWLPSFSR